MTLICAAFSSAPDRGQVKLAHRIVSVDATRRTVPNEK